MVTPHVPADSRLLFCCQPRRRAAISARNLLLLALLVAGAVSVTNHAWAACNLRPVALNSFGAELGATTSPITAPGKTIKLSVRECDSSIGFDSTPANNDIEIVFEPPTGVNTTLPIGSGTSAVGGCTLAGGTRCRLLSFEMPDTTLSNPPLGLAGPARIRVRDGATAELIAEIGALSLASSGCERVSESVFRQFTVLPAPNNFADLEDGTTTQLLATVDGGGNLLVPFDYYGDGLRSVLSAYPGSPIATLLQGSAPVPAQGAGDSNTILEVLAEQESPSSYVRAFTLDGRPLPPLLRISTTGELFGSADAIESVLRIARNDGVGGPDLFELSDRLAGGVGPIVVSTFDVTKESPIPLASLRVRATAIAYARDEAFEGLDLNGDSDQGDFVVQIVDPADGTVTNTGRALTLAADTHLNSNVPITMATGGDLVAFLESEGDQNVDANNDGDFDDDLLRVYRDDGTELTAGVSAADLLATPESVFGPLPIVITGDRVFFRGPGLHVQTLVDGVDGVDGLAASTLQRVAAFSPDGRHLYHLGVDDQLVATFARDEASGELTFVETDPVTVVTVNIPPGAITVVNGGEGGGSITVSPDGAHVYVRANAPVSEIRVFARDDLTGALTPVQTLTDGVGGVDGLDGTGDIRVSPDGNHVYVASAMPASSPSDEAVAVFSRDTNSGILTFVQAQTAGLANIDGENREYLLEISPDGSDVYVAGRYQVAQLRRDPNTGVLAPGVISPALSVGQQLIQGIAMSPDGAAVYLAMHGSSAAPPDLFVMVRDPVTGALLSWPSLEFNTDVAPYDGALGVAADPTGRRLYAYNYTAINVIAVGSPTDTPLAQMRVVERRDLLTGGFDGVPRSAFLLVSPDGRHLIARYANQLSVINAGAELRIFDTETQTVRAARPQVSLAAAAGERALIVTSESLEGADLNSDGDQVDDVVQLVDATGAGETVTSLDLPALEVAMSSEVAAFSAPYDSYASALYVVKPGVSLMPQLIADIGLVGEDLIVGGHVVVFRDFTGDAWAIDLETGELFDLTEGLAVGGVTNAYGRPEQVFALGDRFVAMIIDEDLSGVDLNDDGDTANDRSMVIFDLERREQINVARNTFGCLEMLGTVCPPGEHFTILDNLGLIAFLTLEFLEGEDLNGDGDQNDIVLTLFDPVRRTSQETTVVDDGFADLAPGLIERIDDDATLIVVRNELAEGIDFNGDGLIEDLDVVLLQHDSDGDGVLDELDSCVESINPDRLDVDADGLGDTACDPNPGACPSSPRIGCKQPAAGKSSVLIKNDPEDRKDLLKWKWANGEATATAEFGDPVDGLTSYAVCIYDDAGTLLVQRNGVVPGGICADEKPCWRAKSGKGFRFKDKAGFPAGIQAVTLKEGVAGKPKVVVKGKGELLDPAALDLTLPVQVQFVAIDSDSEVCWETTYDSATKNEMGIFKAKGP